MALIMQSHIFILCMLDRVKPIYKILQSRFSIRNWTLHECFVIVFSMKREA